MNIKEEMRFFLTFIKEKFNVSVNTITTISANITSNAFQSASLKIAVYKTQNVYKFYGLPTLIKKIS